MFKSCYDCWLDDPDEIVRMAICYRELIKRNAKYYGTSSKPVLDEKRFRICGNGFFGTTKSLRTALSEMLRSGDWVVSYMVPKYTNVVEINLRYKPGYPISILITSYED